MKRISLLLCSLLVVTSLTAQLQKKFEPLDVFQLEYAGDPQISPDGAHVIYRRTGFDIMKDRAVGDLWIVNIEDKKKHHKLTALEGSERSARWSPSGDRVAFVRSTEEGSEIYVYWMESGAMAKLTQLDGSPSSLTWSPDGTQLAFSMKVKSKPPVLAKMPSKPKGAKWAKSPRITDRLKHEADGAGYIAPGFNHLFTIPAEGGSPRQLTDGERNYRGSLSWSPDGQNIVFAHFSDAWSLYSVEADGTEVTALEEAGDGWQPSWSGSGDQIAFSSQRDGSWNIYVADADGGNLVRLTNNEGDNLEPVWSPDGDRIAFGSSRQGAFKIFVMDSDGGNVVATGRMGFPSGWTARP